MEINEILFGFRINEKKELCDIGASLYTATHEKSGAVLYYLDRRDENKTFAISFKTIPEDDTGVFHILEHSVLCGSKKFTTKEPFVDLLKGSLNTFLNAMTFPDKTMYPVCSRNDKDFENLTDVYLDAVFHPAVLTDPKIFAQEGWHYEYDREEDSLTRSGVVLSEMQGAFSSADDVASYHICRMLYPDSPYRFESGGEPSAITELTYEKFCEAHKKYYHPSNAQIFLDGDVKLEKILPLIDSYLSEYDKSPLDFDIPEQKKIGVTTREIDYEISPSENKTDKGRLVIGYPSYRFDDQEMTVALSVLLDAIASSNDSPLKKAILASGLCEDMNFTPYDSIKQCSVIIEFLNVRDGAFDELYKLFLDTVDRMAHEGIDKDALIASMNSLEFKIREKDYGTTPIGLVYAMSVLESSLYGGDPAQNLSYEASFTSVREKIKSDYFEKLLYSLFTESTHRAILKMNPDPCLGEKRLAEEKRTHEAIRDSLSEIELESIAKEDELLKKWQAREDTPEDLATVPMLKISDISKDIERIPTEVKSVGKCNVLEIPIQTGGIAYTDLCFDVSDLTREEIFDLRLIVSLSENLPTEKHTAIELQNLIKRELGSLSLSVSPYTVNGETKIYAIVSASALESNKMAIPDLVNEILYTSLYNSKEHVQNVVRQIKLASEEAFISGGHLAAFRRAAAYTDTTGAVQEYYSGYEAHLSVKALEGDFDNLFPALSERLLKLSSKIFTRQRLTVSITGASDAEFSERLVYAVKPGSECTEQRHISPLGILREGIVTPAKSAFCALSGNIYRYGKTPVGATNVVRSLLSYEYLWGAVRVQGGAYGVGLLVRNDGNVGFYSYRDPSPKRTLGCYKESAEFLRSYAKEEKDVTKFIIGAIGDASPLTTPKLKGTLATMRYLRGIDNEYLTRIRGEMLSFGCEDLISAADLIDRIISEGAVCVVGAKDKIEACGDIERIVYI